MSALSRPLDETCCGWGAAGKTGEELLEHFREFVHKVWESETQQRGLSLMLRPSIHHMKKPSDKWPDSEENVVYFCTAAQFKNRFPKHFEEQRLRQRRTEGRVREFLAVLVNVSEKGYQFFEVKKVLRKAILGKFFAGLRQTNDECVVCYEETGLRLRMTRMCHICGANVCVQCLIDLVLDAKHVEGMRARQCPLCATETQTTLSKMCVEIFDEKLPEAHREFINFWDHFDKHRFLKATQCDFAKMTAKMRDAIESDFGSRMHAFLKQSEKKLREARSKSEQSFHASNLREIKYVSKTYIPRLRSALRRSSKMATAVLSDDTVVTAADCNGAIATAAASVTTKPLRVRSDRCARCQKVFWDKREKKRAPKCPKCKRVAYCSGVLPQKAQSGAQFAL